MVERFELERRKETGRGGSGKERRLRSSVGEVGRPRERDSWEAKAGSSSGEGSGLGRRVVEEEPKSDLEREGMEGRERVVVDMVEGVGVVGVDRVVRRL